MLSAEQPWALRRRSLVSVGRTLDVSRRPLDTAGVHWPGITRPNKRRKPTTGPKAATPGPQRGHRGLALRPAASLRRPRPTHVPFGSLWLPLAPFRLSDDDEAGADAEPPSQWQHARTTGTIVIAPHGPEVSSQLCSLDRPAHIPRV